MPTAEARVPTDRAARYLEQLCSHLGSMRHMHHRPGSASGHGGGGHGGGAGMPRVVGVEHAGNRAIVRFADGAWDLTADAGALVLRVDAGDQAALERLKDAFAARVGTIGRREGLRVAWLSQSAG